MNPDDYPLLVGFILGAIMVVILFVGIGMFP